MNVFLLYRRAVSERAKEYAGVTIRQFRESQQLAKRMNQTGLKTFSIIMLSSKRSITIRYSQIISLALKEPSSQKLASTRGKKKTVKI